MNQKNQFEESRLMITLFVFLAALHITFCISFHNFGSRVMPRMPHRFPRINTDPGSWAPNHRFSSKLPVWKKMIARSPLTMKLLPDTNDLQSLKTDAATFHSIALETMSDKSDIFPASEEKEESVSSEVVWRHCSGKNLSAYIDSDIKIRCEFWAPLGSNISWHKDGKPEVFQPHNKLEGQELISPQDVDNQFSYHQNSARSKYEFHLMTLFYIDCVSEEDEGIYSLHIHTPNQGKYTRTFNLKTIGYSNLYSVCCWYCFYQNTFTPRIVDFAKTVIGKKGQELHLPCRPEETSSLSITWNKIDRELNPEDYSITHLGDLKINNLTLHDQGMYSCELHHYKYNIKYDQIATYVKVMD